MIIDSGVATKNAIDHAFNHDFKNTAFNPIFTKLRIKDIQNVSINIVNSLLIKCCFLFINCLPPWSLDFKSKTSVFYFSVFIFLRTFMALIAVGKPAYGTVCIIISSISRVVKPTFKPA